MQKKRDENQICECSLTGCSYIIISSSPEEEEQSLQMREGDDLGWDLVNVWVVLSLNRGDESFSGTTSSDRPRLGILWAIWSTRWCNFPAKLRNPAVGDPPLRIDEVSTVVLEPEESLPSPTLLQIWMRASGLEFQWWLEISTQTIGN